MLWSMASSRRTERQEANKSATGRITIRLHREGSEMVIDVSDDGKGLDVDAIRRKALRARYAEGLIVKSPMKRSWN